MFVAVVTGQNQIAGRCFGHHRNLIQQGGIVRIEQEGDGPSSIALFEDLDTARTVAMAIRWGNQIFEARRARTRETAAGKVIPRSEVLEMVDTNGHRIG